MSFGYYRRNNDDDSPYAVIPTYYGIYDVRRGDDSMLDSSLLSLLRRHRGDSGPDYGTLRALYEDMFRINLPAANTYITGYTEIADRLALNMLEMNRAKTAYIEAAMTGNLTNELSQQYITSFLTQQLNYSSTLAELQKINDIYKKNEDLVKNNPNDYYIDGDGIPYFYVLFTDNRDGTIKSIIPNIESSENIDFFTKGVMDGIFTIEDVKVLTYGYIHDLMHTMPYNKLFYLDAPVKPANYIDIIKNAIDIYTTQKADAIVTEKNVYYTEEEGIASKVTQTLKTVNVDKDSVLNIAKDNILSNTDVHRYFYSNAVIGQLMDHFGVNGVKDQFALANFIRNVVRGEFETERINNNLEIAFNNYISTISTITTERDFTVSIQDLYKSIYGGVDPGTFTTYDNIFLNIHDPLKLHDLLSDMPRHNFVLGNYVNVGGFIDTKPYSAALIGLSQDNYNNVVRILGSSVVSGEAVYNFFGGSYTNEIFYIEGIYNGTRSLLPFIGGDINTNYMLFSELTLNDAVLKNKPLRIDYFEGEDPRFEVHESEDSYVNSLIHKRINNKIEFSPDGEALFKNYLTDVTSMLSQMTDYTFRSFFDKAANDRFFKRRVGKGNIYDGYFTKFDYGDYGYDVAVIVKNTKGDFDIEITKIDYKKEITTTYILRNVGVFELSAEGVYVPERKRDLPMMHGIDYNEIFEVIKHKYISDALNPYRERIAKFREEVHNIYMIDIPRMYYAENKVYDPFTAQEIKRDYSLYVPVEISLSEVEGHLLVNGERIEVDSDKAKNNDLRDSFFTTSKKFDKNGKEHKVYKAVVYIPLSYGRMVDLLSENARNYYRNVVKPTTKITEFKEEVKEKKKKLTNLSGNVYLQEQQEGQSETGNQNQ